MEPKLLIEGLSGNYNPPDLETSTIRVISEISGKGFCVSDYGDDARFRQSRRLDIQRWLTPKPHCVVCQAIGFLVLFARNVGDAEV